MTSTPILRLPSFSPILSALPDRFLALLPTCKPSNLRAFPPVFLLTPLDSALTDSCARKSFRIRSYEKTCGGCTTPSSSSSTIKVNQPASNSFRIKSLQKQWRGGDPIFQAKESHFGLATCAPNVLFILQAKGISPRTPNWDRSPEEQRDELTLRFCRKEPLFSRCPDASNLQRQTPLWGVRSTPPQS